MKRLGLLIHLGLLSACTADYNEYYYGEENLRAIICSWDHYIVMEDLGDSLQIWNLDDECNAGYWTTDNLKIPKKAGKFGKMEITRIADQEIALKLDRGHEVIDFNLSRQTGMQKSQRIINITQMLEIDGQMEQYIQTNSSKADSNTWYLTEKYIADENTEKLDPEEFSQYYRNKKMTKAQVIIKELDEH